jgi:DNA mismatch repair protein MutS2
MVFDNIFIDIGDEQSLDNDLSTYSSKLLNLKYFIENLDRKSLFLVDEMGTGTDPALGGPVAEAALETIAETGAYGVVTTHYSNLKLLAGKQPGIVNGAMLYDSKKMKPLFTLKTGKPGSSFALEIARNIGFPGNVLKKAEEKAGRSQLDFDRQLQDLEVEKEDLVKKTTEVNVADNFLNEMITRYQKMSEELEKSKKDILAQAKEEAKQLLRDSNRVIEKTIKEIREAAAEKERTKEVRNELKEFTEKIVSEPEKPVARAKPAILKEQAPEGKKPAEMFRAPARFNPIINELNNKLANYQLTLDVRGKRAEELWGILQRYIDDAVLLSIPEVRILHGKGNGVLRQVTRDYLRTVKEVKRCRDEAIESGGSGITVVEFR